MIYVSNKLDNSHFNLILHRLPTTKLYFTLKSINHKYRLPANMKLIEAGMYILWRRITYTNKLQYYYKESCMIINMVLQIKYNNYYKYYFVINKRLEEG